MTRWCGLGELGTGNRDLGEDWLCVGGYFSDVGDSQLRFYRPLEDGHYILRYVYVALGAPAIDSLQPQGDGGFLFCVLDAPSCWKFVVFEYKAGKIAPIWLHGDKNWPEFVDLDNDGCDEIVTTNSQSLVNAETGKYAAPMVSVYKYDGSSYKLLKDIVWDERLKLGNYVHVPRNKAEFYTERLR